MPHFRSHLDCDEVLILHIVAVSMVLINIARKPIDCPTGVLNVLNASTYDLAQRTRNFYNWRLILNKPDRLMP